MNNGDSAPAPIVNPLVWVKVHDKYRRPARMLQTTMSDTRAILVTLPRVYFETYGHRYMVTDRRRNVPFAEKIPTQDFVTRSEAVAYAERTFG